MITSWLATKRVKKFDNGTCERLSWWAMKALLGDIVITRPIKSCPVGIKALTVMNSISRRLVCEAVKGSVLSVLEPGAG